MRTHPRSAIISKCLRLLMLPALLGMSLLSPVTALAVADCFVDDDAAPGGDGTSWGTAYDDLQAALVDASCTEIWVAAGRYVPGAAEADTFNVPPGVRVYGGLAGTESDLSERVLGAQTSILSGDIDSNDTDPDGDGVIRSAVHIVGDNSDHVLTLDGTSTAILSGTIIDGFTITAGQADGGSPADNGGGLYCNGLGSGSTCSPMLRNLRFIGNRAAFRGGAVYNDGSQGGESSPQFEDVIFEANLAVDNGGAVNNQGNAGVSSPTLSRVLFTGNSAASGGAMYNNGLIGVSSPSLTNVTFHQNSASNNGGAMLNWGTGNGVDPGHSSPILGNVTFRSNTATGNGGGIFSGGSNSGESVPLLVNVILWGNTAGGSGDEMYDTAASPTINYSVVDGGEAAIDDIDENPFTSGIGNLSDDPLLGPLADNGGFSKTMAPAGISSALETGVGGGSCPGVDQRGVTRPQGSGCERGAHERIPLEFPADFESDGLSDLAYFRPSTGEWGILQSSDAFRFTAPDFYSWGASTDTAVIGDFDGDSRWDPTVRTPPSGGQSSAYLMLLSSTGYNYGASEIVPAGWPGLNDTPAVGDFNGDGIHDPAIWRGNTGVWIIPLSPAFTSYMFIAWGASGDVPIAVDIDGDGQTDPGYWTPGTGTWGFLQSSQGYSFAAPLFFAWGSALDIPVPADYDGDNYADIAVVIPPSGGQSRAYRILTSSSGYNPAVSLIIPAGWPGLGDTPVYGDYDGDGKADAGLWRGNTGIWIIPKSSTNNASYLYAAWGASGDQVVK